MLLLNEIKFNNGGNMRFIKGFFKFIFSFLIAIVIILSIGAFAVLPKLENEYEKDVFSNRDSINYLLIGKESSATVDNKDTSGPVHSDTLMIATIFPKQNKVELTSIPRDTYIEYLPNSKKRHQKINAAFFLGGVDETRDVLEDFLDIKIDNYMVVDYKTIIGIIDTLGGIDIEWEYNDYHYEDNWTDPPLVIDFKKGINHLDGEKAVSYLRTRKAYKDQDLGRMKAQQQFLVKLFEEMKDPKNIVLVPKMLRIVEENTETNLEFKEMLYLAYYGLRNVDKDNIILNTVEGRDKRINGIDYYEINKEAARELFRN